MNTHIYKNSSEVEALLVQMAEALRQRLTMMQIERPIIIGIHTGGVWVAEHLHRLLALREPMGILDISFYRDDFTRTGFNPQVRPSYLPIALDNRHLLLIDDVLHTGRTIRAALNEIFDYGRPASVQLVVLAERSGRELPIQADIAGIRPQLESGQHITLIGPKPLSLILGQSSNRKSRQSPPHPAP